MCKGRALALPAGAAAAGLSLLDVAGHSCVCAGGRAAAALLGVAPPPNFIRDPSNYIG